MPILHANVKTRILSTRFYSVPEAADILGVVDEVIRRYLRTGRLHGAKTHTKGLRTEWRIRGSHIHAFMRHSFTMAKPATAQARKSGSLLDLMREIEALSAKIPQEEKDRLPKDWAKNIDHYLYGARKR